jgi:superfamily II RNA helicase
MVRTFDETTAFNEDECHMIREKYPTLSLDTFQLAAMTAIRRGIHPLVTAHTGSGKTLPAEHAIEYFVGEKGKKVIYTAPIKSLSNQKFHEFKAKFPTISFGIMTGDIKFAPDADCVIMTTEILRNSLANGVFSGDDVGCVVFDEVHYINDASRGKVWEECIMWLPANVIMVLLSATIDRVVRFAEWIEEVKGREVWICSTGKRVVPLIHYTYLTANSADLKGLDKDDRDFVNGFIDTPKIIKTPDGLFVERNIVETFRAAKMIGSGGDVKRSTVIHRVVTYLKENEMLPAICFVFSRKRANDMARQLSVNLLEGDEPVRVEREVLSVLRRLPNWEEYVRTAEYEEMIELMRRGVAVHHSGVIPVLREIVEIMFGKGYVRLLFATETFAVGVNMPTKTVLFTDIQKFSESQFRFLHPHEYTQMAGRAGRRGLDKVGHVIHLFNLYDGVSAIGQHVLKNVLAGVPQTLQSKYSIDYDTVLNVAADGKGDLVERSLQVAMTSMAKYEYESVLASIDKLLAENQVAVEKIRESLSPVHIKFYEEWLEKKNAVDCAPKKQKMRLSDELKDFIEQAKKKHAIDLNKIIEKRQGLATLEHERRRHTQDRSYFADFLRVDAIKTVDILERHEVIADGMLVSPTGLAARCFKEVNCLAFSVALKKHSVLFEALTAAELVGFLSMFVFDKEDDDVCHSIDNPMIVKLVEVFENEFGLVLNGEKAEYFMDWCGAVDDTECKRIMSDSGMYSGEFVKAVLKINNICQEIDKASEIYGYTWLSKMLSEIQSMTLKSIVTAQSLYL